MPEVPGRSSRPGDGVTRAEAERKTIDRLYRAWLDAIEAASPEYVTFFTADAVLMPPHEPAVVGRDAIESWVRSSFEQYAFEGRETASEITFAGDLAVRRFTVVGTFTSKSDGNVAAIDQKCLNVLRRQPDGAWKIHTHMWSSNGSAPSTSEWIRREARDGRG